MGCGIARGGRWYRTKLKPIFWVFLQCIGECPVICRGVVTFERSRKFALWLVEASSGLILPQGVTAAQTCLTFSSNSSSSPGLLHLLPCLSNMVNFKRPEWSLDRSHTVGAITRSTRHPCFRLPSACRQKVMSELNWYGGVVPKHTKTGAFYWNRI